MLLNHVAVDGENTVVSLVFNNQAHQIAIDLIGPGGKAINQRSIAKYIDNAGNSVACFRHHLAGAFSEKASSGTDSGKTEVDVFGHLHLRQRSEMKVRGNPLGKLNQIGLGKQFLELGLPDKNQLQELVFIDVDIREHSEALERIFFQILRFINDDYRSVTLSVLRVQKILKALYQDPDIALEGLPQRHQYPLKQLIPAARCI